jgi:hypothetical protein
VNRRGFLAALLAAPVAASVPEIWTPSKTIFLPPRGGWVDEDIAFDSGNLVMTLDEFTRKYTLPAMKMLAEAIERDVIIGATLKLPPRPYLNLATA